MSDGANLPAPIDEVDVPRQKRKSQIISSEYSAAFRGPLPPPELLGRYEELCPGSSNRIIQLAEQEADHRRSIEQAIARTNIEQAKRDSDEARRGQICALLITITAIVAGAYTALQGHEIAGSIIGVGGIGSIVTTFLAGRASQPPEPPQGGAPPPPKQRNTKPQKRK